MSTAKSLLIIALIGMSLSAVSHAQNRSQNVARNSPVQKMGFYKDFIQHKAIRDVVKACSLSPKAKRVLVNPEQEDILKIALIDAMAFCSNDQQWLALWQIFSPEPEHDWPQFRFEIEQLIQTRLKPSQQLLLGYILLRYKPLHADFAIALLKDLSDLHPRPLYQLVYHLALAQQAYNLGEWCDTAKYLLRLSDDKQGVRQVGYSKKIQQRLEIYTKNISPYCLDQK